MNKTALKGLVEYLTSTLSASDMRWVSEQLTNFADSLVTPPPMRRYTMEEINAMLDEAERGIAAGEGIPDEEVWGELEEMEREEQEELEAFKNSRLPKQELELAEAV